MGVFNLSHNPRVPVPSRAQTLLVVPSWLTVPLGTPFGSWLRRGILGYPPASLYAAHRVARAAPAGDKVRPTTCLFPGTARVTAHQKGIPSQKGALAKQSTQPFTLQTVRL